MIPTLKRRLILMNYLKFLLRAVYIVLLSSLKYIYIYIQEYYICTSPKRYIQDCGRRSPSTSSSLICQHCMASHIIASRLRQCCVLVHIQ